MPKNNVCGISNAGLSKGNPSSEQKTLSPQKGVKRAAATPESKQRHVKAKSAEKGKITSFFTKNPA